MNKIRYKDEKYLCRYDLDIKLFEALGLDIFDLRPNRNVFLLDTKQGKKILKMINYDDDRLNFIIHSTEYLRERYDGILKINKLPNGEWRFKWKGNDYILLDYFEGTEFNIANPIELEIITEAVAKLHNAGRGIQEATSKEMNEKNSELFKLKDYFKNSKKDLEKLKEIGAGLVTQLLRNPFYLRIMVQHPPWSNGMGIGRIGQGQRIGQGAGILANEQRNVGVLTYFARVGAADEALDIGCRTIGLHHTHKTFKLLVLTQQSCKQLLFLGRKFLPAGHLVEQQRARFFAIIHRVVQLVAQQFIVLYQAVVGAFGKQQGRHIKRIDQPVRAGLVGKQVLGIVVHNVVSAKVVDTVQKTGELIDRSLVKNGTVMAQCTNVVYFAAF